MSMLTREILCIVPDCSPDYAGLHRILPYMKEMVGTVNSGDILSKHQAVVLATFLLAHPALATYYLKAMHLELPEYSTSNRRLDSPGAMFSLLFRGISHAGSSKVNGKVELDLFTAQYENKKFDIGSAWPADALLRTTNMRSRSLLTPISGHDSRIEIVNHRATSFDLKKIVRGILRVDPHIFSDGFPGSLFNILRYHDHRKGMIFTFRNGEKIMLFNTFNFDDPHDIDAALVITNQELITIIQQLFSQPIPKNEIVPGDSWTVYQDGAHCLDPEKPEQSSPTLQRVLYHLKNPDTHSITWCSQFLPDTEEIQLLEKRLTSNTINYIEICAPSRQLWSSLYTLSGGLSSLIRLRLLQKKYPEKIRLTFTSEYLHAKFLLINGQTLFFTSHNFNRTLVRARTSELGVEFHQIDSSTYDGIHKLLRRIRASSAMRHN